MMAPDAVNGAFEAFGGTMNMVNLRIVQLLQ